MSYTPGPWEIMESANAFVVMGSNAKHVVIIPLFREYAWSKEEWEGLNLEEQNKVRIANACLIAAAPELLEACEALLAVIDVRMLELSEPEWGKRKREAERKARAVCAKAQGVEGVENA